MPDAPDHVADDRRTMRLAWTAITYSVLAGLFIATLVIVLRRIDRGHSGDFRHFYFAGRALRMHQDPYAVGTGEFTDSVVNEPGDEFRAGTGGYLYPPLIAVLYMPIADLSYRSAERVVLVVDLLFIGAGVLIATRAFVSRLATTTPLLLPLVATIAVAINADKVRGELQMFQTNSLIFLMFALTLRWLDRRPWLAGVPLGVILNIKYLSLPLLPWLLVRRRFKAAAVMTLSTVAFALLPALVSGWSANLRHLRTSFGGLAKMVGVDVPGDERANVEDIKNNLSVSITSGLVRMTDRHGAPQAVGLALTAAVAVGVAGVILYRYHRCRLPAFLWPADQTVRPYSALVAVEFSVLIAATLCFSPQTNTRHLVLALLVTIPGATLVLTPRPIGHKLTVAIGLLVMLAGFTLPPGNRSTRAFYWSERWFSVGGPCWCLLVATLAVTWAGLTGEGNPDGTATPTRR